MRQEIWAEETRARTEEQVEWENGLAHREWKKESGKEIELWSSCIITSFMPLICTNCIDL